MKYQLLHDYIPQLGYICAIFCGIHAKKRLGTVHLK